MIEIKIPSESKFVVYKFSSKSLEATKLKQYFILQKIYKNMKIHKNGFLKLRGFIKGNLLEEVF